MGHGKFIDNLRRKTKEVRIKQHKEDEKVSADGRRRVKRNDRISKLRETDPGQAAQLVLENIFEDLEDEAVEGHNEHVWNSEGNISLREMVVTELRRMKFKVEIRCGHGHGGGQKCDGTTYPGSCWPEVVISW